MASMFDKFQPGSSGFLTGLGAYLMSAGQGGAPLGTSRGDPRLLQMAMQAGPNAQRMMMARAQEARAKAAEGRAAELSEYQIKMRGPQAAAARLNAYNTETAADVAYNTRVDNNRRRAELQLLPIPVGPPPPGYQGRANLAAPSPAAGPQMMQPRPQAAIPPAPVMPQQPAGVQPAPVMPQQPAGVQPAPRVAPVVQALQNGGLPPMQPQQTQPRPSGEFGGFSPAEMDFIKTSPKPLEAAQTIRMDKMRRAADAAQAQATSRANKTVNVMDRKSGRVSEIPWNTYAANRDKYQLNEKPKGYVPGGKGQVVDQNKNYAPNGDLTVKGIRGIIEPDIKALKTIRKFHDRIISASRRALKDGNSQAALTAMIQFQKVIDDGAVVRKGDIELATYAQSLSEMAKTFIQHKKDGIPVGTEMIKQMVDTMGDFMNQAVEDRGANITDYLEHASSLNYRTGGIILPSIHGRITKRSGGRDELGLGKKAGRKVVGR